jgi:hypothetical protein
VLKLSITSLSFPSQGLQVVSVGRVEEGAPRGVTKGNYKNRTLKKSYRNQKIKKGWKL